MSVLVLSSWFRLSKCTRTDINLSDNLNTPFLVWFPLFFSLSVCRHWPNRNTNVYFAQQINKNEKNQIIHWTLFAFGLTLYSIIIHTGSLLIVADTKTKNCKKVENERKKISLIHTSGYLLLVSKLLLNWHRVLHISITSSLRMAWPMRTNTRNNGDAYTRGHVFVFLFYFFISSSLLCFHSSLSSFLFACLSASAVCVYT